MPPLIFYINYNTPFSTHKRDGYLVEQDIVNWERVFKNRTIMDNKPTISKTHDALMSEQDKMRICEIRFDCLVKMHDYGCRETKSTMPFVPKKSLPPQWFKSEMTITLETIRYANEYEIGAMIKKAYRELELSINNYENS